MDKKQNPNRELWEQAKSAGTLELVRILALLKQRGWSPNNPAEKEWFEELMNLSAPCNSDAISQNAELLKDRNSIEVIRIISPQVSAGNYSIHFYDDSLLTHCPASSGLVECWAIPTCEPKFNLKLYSRRSAFHLSRNKQLLVSYTDRNTISIDSFPENSRIHEWEHPELKFGNSYRIEILSDEDEIIATDMTGGIYFLSLAPNAGLRKYDKILPRRQTLLAAAKSGRYLLVPRLDLTSAVVWSFPKGERVAKVDVAGTTEISFLSAAFSPDSNYLIATGVNELQVRSAPFADLDFSIPLGLGNNLPIFAFSPDSKLLAVLPRSNPAQIQIFDLESGQVVQSLRLPAYFGRFPVNEMRITPDCAHILLTGTEDVYLVKIDGSDFSEERRIILLNAEKRIRNLSSEDVKQLDSLYRSRWMSSQMRPWVDMMMYLHKRCLDFDIELEEAEMASLDDVGAFEIELEDAK